MYQITMRIIKLLLLLQMVISLNSCGIYRPTDAREVSPDPEKRVQKNLEEGRGLRLFDTERKVGTTYDFASSNELWRATLDTIDFMPLTTANYSGGIIVTDWYSDNQNLNENLKIFYRKCDSLNKCKIFEKEGNLSKELKKEILKKASTYQRQAKNKKEKKD